MIRVNVRGNSVVSGVTARQYALALVAVRYARYVAVRFSPKHHESSTHTHTFQSTISIVHPKSTSLETTTQRIETHVLDDSTSSCTVLLERKLLHIYESNLWYSLRQDTCQCDTSSQSDTVQIFRLSSSCSNSRWCRVASQAKILRSRFIKTLLSKQEEYTNRSEESSSESRVTTIVMYL